MSRSRQLNLPPAPVQTLSRLRESAAPPETYRAGKEVSLARERRLTDLLAEAVSATCTEKEAALAQGYEPPYWSRIKSGEKKAYLDPVGNLPEATQRAFVKRWGQQLRMRVTDEDEQKAAVAELLVSAARVMQEIA